jgi:nitroreductase
MIGTLREQNGFRAQPYEGEVLEPLEALTRSKAFLELMSTRRSIRHFASDAVPVELIENAIRVAGTAPSGANQQPWTFVVVADSATKERIRHAAEQEEELLYRERAAAEYLEAIRPIGTNAEKPHITDAIPERDPGAPRQRAAVFADPGRLRGPRRGRTRPEQEVTGRNRRLRPIDARVE